MSLQVLVPNVLAAASKMTQTAAQPLYGKCASIFGRRAVCIFSSAVFLLGSLGCGLSRTYPQLLAARALAGVGGGGLTVMTGTFELYEDRTPS